VLFRVVLNGYPSVDSFFTIGGCLLSYLSFKHLEKTSGKLNIFMVFIHRYIRLPFEEECISKVLSFRITGVYAIVIGCFATLYRYLAIGPRNIADEEVSKDKV